MQLLTNFCPSFRPVLRQGGRRCKEALPRGGVGFGEASPLQLMVIQGINCVLLVTYGGCCHVGFDALPSAAVSTHHATVHITLSTSMFSVPSRQYANLLRAIVTFTQLLA